MIKELAGFEKALDRVQATETSLLNTLTFAASPSNPHPKTGYASTFLLILPSTDPAPSVASTTNGIGASTPEPASRKDSIAGMALYFTNYSTWLACPGIYLEDLYVRPAYRRRGYATLLFKALAEEVSRISDGKGRLEWSCLRWNEGALKFYEWLGGKRMEDWVTIRVEGEGLNRLKSVDEKKAAAK